MSAFKYIKDAREITGKSTATIDRWIADNKFPKPHGKINGNRYWMPAQFKAWHKAIVAGDAV